LPSPVRFFSGDFHSIDSIASSTTSDPGDYWPLANLIQGPGSGFDENDPHDSLGSGNSSYAWVTGQPNGNDDYYANGEPPPVLVIDLGADRPLSEISTWGYNEGNTNGAKDFLLRFATAADGPDGFGTSITFSPGFEAAFATGPRDSHPFGRVVTARYVEMTITDNWRGLQGSKAGGDRVGLGEIAFEDAAVDSDGDGLPDDWEIAHNLDPNDDGSIDPDNGAAGDPDTDSSTNISEYQRGTDPRDDDSDNDGLEDGVETDTGTYNNPGDTGTKPLVADSDGDGISDGDEVAGGSDPNDINDPNPAPDPNDFDGDGLHNTWETDNNLDPNDDGSTDPDNGAWGDPDGDGLPNDEEFFMNSDPQVNESGKAWQPRPEKARLMVISAHPDDESIFFGGTYPYYTQVRQLPTVGISMTSGDWNRVPEIREAEFRNATWAYGLRNQPIFPRFKDYPTSTLDQTWDVWADGVLGDGSDVEEGKLKATRALAYWIRRYRPDVVVTHDFDGEYGHKNHQATAWACTWAVPMAADPAVDLDGLPAWQVKKFYIHNYDPGSPNGTVPIFHDHWQDVSIDSNGDGTPDQTPIDTANVGSDFHVSQGQPNVSTCYASGETSSGWEPYPCEWWGLYSSTVGPDTIEPDFLAPDANNSPMTYSGWALGDFFEHLTTFPDSDYDELADTWELDHFVSLAAAHPDADDDHDGLDNRYEFVAGLDPHAQDRTDFTIAGGSVDFTVPGTTGVTGYEGLTRRYQLLHSPDMVDWSTVVAEGIADGTPLTYPIPGGQTRGFYRLVLSIE
jgi:LmbE family N-acetylglucosaminyl deacetylase